MSTECSFCEDSIWGDVHLRECRGRKIPGEKFHKLQRIRDIIRRYELSNQQPEDDARALRDIREEILVGPG